MSSSSTIRSKRKDRARLTAFVSRLREISTAKPIGQTARSGSSGSAAPTVDLGDWVARTRALTLSPCLTGRSWYIRRLADLSTRLPGSQGTFMPFGNHFVAAMHVFEAYKLADALISMAGARERSLEDVTVSQPAREAASEEATRELSEYMAFCRQNLEIIALSEDRAHGAKSALWERMGIESTTALGKLFAIKQSSINAALLPTGAGGSPEASMDAATTSSPEQHSRSNKCCADPVQKELFSKLCREVSRTLGEEAHESSAPWEMPQRLWRVTDHLWLTHVRLQNSLDSLRESFASQELDRTSLARAVDLLGQYESFDEGDEPEREVARHTLKIAEALKILTESELRHRDLVRELNSTVVTLQYGEIDEHLAKQVAPKIDALVRRLKRACGSGVIAASEDPLATREPTRAGSMS